MRVRVFVAGPLIPLPLPPFGCLKSSNNYGHLVQLRLSYTANAAAPLHPNLLGMKAMADMVVAAAR